MMERKEALKKLEEARKRGEVDEDILSILEILNSSSHFYTTSSCSGRIVIMQLPEIGDKKNAVFLGKWHHEVGIEDILNSISNYSEGYLFMLVQSSIIHIVADSLQSAREIMRIALESGFKYTSIKVIKNNGTLVEILSAENLHIPLGERGELKIGYGEIEFFTKMANLMLRRIKQKLKIFEEKIKSSPLFSS